MGPLVLHAPLLQRTWRKIAAWRYAAKQLREPPDARSNADLQFFNMAVHTLEDMKEHHDAMVYFNLYYVEQADNIKRKADELGISRPTYYNRAKAFARRTYWRGA